MQAAEPDQGDYTVTLDGQSVLADGFANPSEFQQVLFSAEGLNDSPHTLTMEDSSTDSSRPWVDIDFIIFTAGKQDK